ncbi:MAG: 4-alpha-glucanotransferase, partial [Candidatus Omnitrophota bacterium]
GLVADGWLDEEHLSPAPEFLSEKVDYDQVRDYKAHLLGVAYERFRDQKKGKKDFEKFCVQNADWLEDYSLFVSFKEHYDGALWTEWPEEIKEREASALKGLREKFSEKLEKVKFFQFLFFEQWLKLKSYCHARHVSVIGDIPIYVNLDSADVWANPEIFKLDEKRQPLYVAGVPPDYFSADGQRWGNPVYDWAKIEETGYQWWIKRIGHSLKLYDWLRIDHFRGFNAFWQIPVEEQTGRNGQWVEGPADKFFQVLADSFDKLPIIAEDLGIITPDVTETMNRFGFPGMKVLLFAFSGDLETHPYIPKNFVKNCVVYTGTHDNNTVQGWYRVDATEEEKNNLNTYLGPKIKLDNIHWEFIRMAMRSVALLAIIPAQDLLGLDERSRMNIPSTPQGNWQWRIQPEALAPALTQKLAKLTIATKRD